MKSTTGRHVTLGVEAMATLSEYLELALDKGAQLVMVRGRISDASTLYVGDVASVDEDLKKCGVIQNDVADAILDATESGFNELNINGEAYRFMRFFAEVGHQGAVVFAAV